MTTMTFHITDLPQKRASAIKRRAQQLGVTKNSYVRQLIEEDLELERKARTMTFAEIAAPFQEAFAGVSDEELDRLVDEARTRHYQRIAKRKR
jgi:hypothetical protein